MKTNERLLPGHTMDKKDKCLDVSTFPLHIRAFPAPGIFDEEVISS